MEGNNKNNNVFIFDNGRIVDMNQYPPAPVTWLYNSIDTICDLNGIYPICSNWRSYLDIPDDSWFSEQYKFPHIQNSIPTLLSYTDFRNSELLTDEKSAEPYYYSYDAIYRYAFQTTSTELGNIGTPTACFALLILVLLFRLVKAFFVPKFSALGKTAAVHSHGRQWVTDNQIRITKFGEYVFRLIYHASISIYGIYYFHDKEWWQPNRTFVVFQGYPFHEILPGMIWYYLLQMAYNVDAFLSLLLLSFKVEFRSPMVSSSSDKSPSNNTKLGDMLPLDVLPIQSPIVIRWSKDVRGDFQEMFMHHFATNMLVLGSSYFGFSRIGSMVFLVHDISDVPVDLSKLANFLKWKLSTIVCFGCMTASWVYTRLYLLPYIIYWTMITKCHYVLEYGFPPIMYVGYRHFFYFFMGLLICLHFSWFLMFLRMFYTIIVKYECHDYSEYKSGEQHNQKERGRKSPSKVVGNKKRQ